MKKNVTQKELFFEEVEWRRIKGEELSSDNLLDVIESYVDVPSAKTLKNRYLKQRLAGWIGSLKDKSGVRVYLSNGKEYVNLDKEMSLEKVTSVENKLRKQRNGYDKSLEKAEVAREHLEGKVQAEQVGLENVSAVM